MYLGLLDRMKEVLDIYADDDLLSNVHLCHHRDRLVLLESVDVTRDVQLVQDLVQDLVLSNPHQAIRIVELSGAAILLPDRQGRVMLRLGPAKPGQQLR